MGQENCKCNLSGSLVVALLCVWGWGKQELECGVLNKVKGFWGAGFPISTFSSQRPFLVPPLSSAKWNKVLQGKETFLVKEGIFKKSSPHRLDRHWYSLLYCVLIVKTVLGLLFDAPWKSGKSCVLLLLSTFILLLTKLCSLDFAP